jgi:hypothetical protein
MSPNSQPNDVAENILNHSGLVSVMDFLAGEVENIVTE